MHRQKDIRILKVKHILLWRPYCQTRFTIFLLDCYQIFLFFSIRYDLDTLKRIFYRILLHGLFLFSTFIVKENHWQQ